MSLDDIPAGVTTFIDSTVLHYAIAKFEAATPQCVRFLDRIAKSELMGCLTLPVLNDAVHKVMCSEAVARFKRPRAGLVNWLKQNPGAGQRANSCDRVARFDWSAADSIFGGRPSIFGRSTARY